MYLSLSKVLLTYIFMIFFEFSFWGKNGEIHFIHEYFGHEVVVGVNSDFQINFYMYKRGGGRVEFNRPQ